MPDAVPAHTMLQHRGFVGAFDVGEHENIAGAVGLGSTQNGKPSEKRDRIISVLLFAALTSIVVSACWRIERSNDRVEKSLNDVAEAMLRGLRQEIQP